MSDILNAVGITAIPPGDSEANLVRKILTSQVVYNRVMEFLVATNAADVIRAMPKLERDALRNKLVPPAPGKIPVRWEIIQPSQSTNGQMTILASHDKETMRWGGDWRKAREVEFYGEHVPSDIAEVYILNFSAPRQDPEYAREKRQAEREALEAAMDRQSHTGEAALADEALAGFPKY